MRHERSFELSFPTLAQQKLTVVLTDSIEASWNRHIEEAWEGTGEELGLFWTDDKGSHFIFLPWKCSDGTVAHEAYHAIHSMFEFMDSKPDDEMIAYHLGFIVDNIAEKKHVRRTRR